MICVKCGLEKGKTNKFFECDDCQEFSKLVKTVFEDIHLKMDSAATVDPTTDPIFRLVADSSFITATNPQTAIYYKISDFIVTKASEGKLEITEDEINRCISTTRGWGDSFKIFEELGLVKIRPERYRRVLLLTDKTTKFANQYVARSISEIGVSVRLAHIYGGYVLLYILNMMANMTPENYDNSLLPYHQRPRTLWIILMFLWSNAFLKNDTFSDEDLRAFVSKRRMPSITRGKITQALEAKDGRSTQGLIKDVYLDDSEKKFKFEDYVLVEMERIRELTRERER